MPSAFDEQPFDITRMTNHGEPERTAGIPMDTARRDVRSGIQWQGAGLDYHRLLRQYWLWLVCGTIAGVLIGHLIYRRLGPEYVATARVMITNRNMAPIPGQSGSGISIDRGVDTTLIKSPLIVEKAIQRHALQRLPSLAQSKDPVEDITDSLQVKLSAGQGTSDRNVLDISARLASRDDAKKIVAALIEAYHEYLQDDHSESQSDLAALVSRATQQLQSELRQREADYEKFRAAAPVHLKSPARSVNGQRLSVSSNIHQENLEALDRERTQLLLRKAEVQSQIQSVESALAAGRPRSEVAASIQLFVAPTSRLNDSSSASALASSPAAEAQRQNDGELLRLILEERQLQQQYGADWPALVTVREQIAALRQYYHSQGLLMPDERRKTTGNSTAPGSRPDAAAPAQPFEVLPGMDIVDVYLASQRQLLAGFTLRELELDRVYKAEFDKARQLAKFLEEDRRHMEELDRLDGLWNSIQVQAAKFNLDKENLGYALKVIAPPRDEVSLKRVIKLYGAGLAGVLGLIGALIFFREWQDTTLRSVEELRQSLPLPILGTVPAFTSSHRRPGSALPSALCSFHRPGSAESEAYRSVRTAFFVSLTDQQRVIQVTSPEPGDGKSTFIANLAVTIAQAGRRVLLIDADLRQPTVHQLFGLRTDAGTTEVLEGQLDLLTALQPTSMSGLTVLTSGRTPENPAELLASSRFTQLLRDAAEQFDLVLIDTPPLLAVSDPCIVAPRVDGLLLVLRMGKNRRVAANRATDLLATHHAPVIGIIANGTDAVIEGYGYGYDRAYRGYVSDQSSPAAGSVREAEAV